MQTPKRKPGKFSDVKPDRFITESKLHSMKSALRQILEIDLPQASKEASLAKEQGDFSENAAYSDAKARLRRLQNRAASFKDRIMFAIVIKKGAADDGSIKIGATVSVKMNGRKKTYEIVGSQETSPGTGRISHLSPLGVLLMGKKAGETVILIHDNREIPCEILKVE